MRESEIKVEGGVESEAEERVRKEWERKYCEGERERE